VSFLAINANDWGIVLSSYTFFIIMVGIIAISLGEMFARLIFKRQIISEQMMNISKRKKVIKPSNNATNFIILYMITTLIWYFLAIRSAVLTSGLTNLTFLGAYRASDSEINSILKLCLIINLSIAYYYLFAFIDNFINFRVKNKKYLIPVVIHLISSTLSSGRMEILYTLITIVALSYIVYYQKHGWNLKFNFKIIRKMILAGVLSIGLFFILGYFTGKSNMHSFYYIISLYIGSPVAALDYFLSGFDYNLSNFGNETLIGVNNLLEMVGIELSMANSRILPFVHLGNMPSRTNIYTSFRRVMSDYNYFGMIIYQFLIGVSYSSIYQKIKMNRYKNKHFAILIYVYLFRYLFFQFVDERILMNIFSLTTIAQITVFWLLLRYFTRYKEISYI
jgi:oligosaccharide repeat unit polymerase